MLVQLGRRTAHLDLVDALLECHTRIRGFLEQAARLAAATGRPAAEVEATAAQIARYFTTAFPLHVADEEYIAEHLSPSRALAQIHADHHDHAPLVNQLVALCNALALEPHRLPARAGELAETCETLALVLEAHLSLEELLVFPRIQQLPAGERAAILADMRRRREVAVRAS